MTSLSVGGLKLNGPLSDSRMGFYRIRGKLVQLGRNYAANKSAKVVPVQSKQYAAEVR